VGLDQAAIEGLRAMIMAGGAGQLAVGDLRAGEVAGLSWSGNPAHLRSVAAALERAARGLEDYLVVRAPAGQPVAKLRIDYTSEHDTGVFSQLATMDRLQGLGIATMLIGAGEQRVRARGLARPAAGFIRARRLTLRHAPRIPRPAMTWAKSCDARCLRWLAARDQAGGYGRPEGSGAMRTQSASAAALSAASDRASTTRSATRGSATVYQANRPARRAWTYPQSARQAR